MKIMTSSHAEDELTQLANRFAHWRQNRPTPRSRIPQPLWEQAAALTETLSISRVAKHLGLCTTDLKRHCSAHAATSESFPTAMKFVEVTAASSWVSTSAEVDLQRPDGTRMRSTYHDPQPSLAVLVQTFLETP